MPGTRGDLSSSHSDDRVHCHSHGRYRTHGHAPCHAFGRSHVHAHCHTHFRARIRSHADPDRQAGRPHPNGSNGILRTGDLRCAHAAGADGHRAAGAAAETGDRLPGGGMTVQPETTAGAPGADRA